VLRPAAAILHYAADNQLRPWLRVKLFREARPRTRAVTQDVARAVVNSVPPPTYRRQRSAKWLARAAATHAKKRLLLLWLFRQGMRISDALRVRGECIDMERRTVAYRIGKADRDVVKPLHDEVWEFLANDAPAPGWLFPWRTKSGVYKWLRPMCRALGIAFTPHMARHSVGKWLNEEGASLRTIMDTLDHADPKSSVRYQSTDIEVIRATGRRLGKLVSAGNAKGETD
jgi:integrase